MRSVAAPACVDMSGEFELIDSITAHFAQHRGVLLGPGDDAAVLATSDARVAASTDMLVEDVHFKTAWTTPHELGRRAAAQNFADIAAMGGVPTALLVAVGAPPSLDPTWFDDVALGLETECALVGASVIGGDLAQSDKIVVAVTVLGDLQGRQPVTRAGARPGDIVALAGRVGWSVAGWLSLQRNVHISDDVVAAYRAPAPPYAAGVDAAVAGATAMIDVSDGLVADAGHIADASDVTLEIETVALPVDDLLREAASALAVDLSELLLTSGEDHPLLATFPAGTQLPPGFRPIGRVAARGAAAVLVDGAPYTGRGGWTHF